MEFWLQQHWMAMTGGGLGLWPGVWLLRRLRFKHFYIAGDSWTFEYRRPRQTEVEGGWERTPKVVRQNDAR